MTLCHLVYYSQRVSQGENVLLDILRTARRNNARLGITGALFAHDDRFFQVMEGPRDALSEVLCKIMADDRHTNVVLTLFEDLNYRMFDDWHMASIDPNNPDVLKAYGSFMAEVSSPDLLPGREIWAMIEAMAEFVLDRPH